MTSTSRQTTRYGLTPLIGTPVPTPQSQIANNDHHRSPNTWHAHLTNLHQYPSTGPWTPHTPQIDLHGGLPGCQSVEKE